MPLNESFIKVSRNIIKHWLFDDPDQLIIWIYLICVAQNIDSDTMSKYAEIYEARKGLVVAEILDNSCEGCGAMVPPQSINEALSQNIIFCGNCSRFLFKNITTNEEN